MANTIGFGQGAVNNTIGYGQGAKVGSSFSNTQSIELDGIDDYVDCGNPTSLQITGELSISAWVKTSDNRDAIIVSKDDQSNRSFALWANLAGGGANYTSLYLFSGGSATSVISNTLLTAGTWNHVMAVFKPSTYMRIYVNGVLDAENTTSIPSGIDNDPANFLIGKGLSAGYNFYGNIDEVAIWNSDQSSNIGSIYSASGAVDLSSLSPVSWWRFEGSGTTATDSGSGGNDGTLTNGVTRSSNVPT